MSAAVHGGLAGQGAALYRQGHWSQAEAALRAAWREAPHDGHSFCLLLEVLLVQGKAGAALQLAEGTPPQTADATTLRLLTGRACLDAGQPQRGLEIIFRAWQDDPASAVAAREYARLLRLAGALPDALRVLRHGLRHAPTQPDLHRALAGCLLELGDADGADRHAALLPYAGDEGVADRVLLAQIRLRQRRLPEAVALLREALHAQLARPRVAAHPAGSPRFDPEQAEARLWQALVQLAEAGVHAFATTGTLLGLVRDGRLLPFDKDLDIGLPWPEMDAAVACLQAHGWRERPQSFGLTNPRALVDPASGLSLDLCGFALEAGSGLTIGGFWMAGVPFEWNRITEYPALKLHCVRRTEGEHWQLADPQCWLAALYGDWRTPDPDFDTTIAAHNLRSFSWLVQFYAFSRILTAWQQGKPAKARAALRHSLRHLPDDPLLRAVATHLTHS